VPVELSVLVRVQIVANIDDSILLEVHLHVQVVQSALLAGSHLVETLLLAVRLLDGVRRVLWLQLRLEHRRSARLEV
jgi:hypothetical protein